MDPGPQRGQETHGARGDGRCRSRQNHTQPQSPGGESKCSLKGTGAQTGLEGGRVEFTYTCRSSALESVDFAACASNGTFIFLPPRGPRKHLSQAPGVARCLAAASAHHYLPPGVPQGEPFQHATQALGLPGSWKHSQVVLCRQDACLESPCCQRSFLPGGRTARFAVRPCDTKGSPGMAGRPGAAESRHSAPSAWALSSALSS